jgi:HAD superfamily hydrolase (TIGR01509 family)
VRWEGLGDRQVTREIASSTALLDLDGTLVDTNYHHVLAWSRAFRDSQLNPPLWRLHRAIGMGGDKLVSAVAGDKVEESQGEKIRAGHQAYYRALINEARPLAGTGELLKDLRKSGWIIILASSAESDELDYYLDLLDAREAVDGWTGAEDVAASKPSPDIVQAALDKGGSAPDEALMIGDSVWDVEAASRAGVGSVCVLTGGYSAQELFDAGASAVYESLDDLREGILG